MADPRFFKKFGALELANILEVSGARVAGDIDTARSFSDVAALSDATEDVVSFLDNVKYRDEFLVTKAGACFVSEEMVGLAPEGVICLVSENPYRSFALTSQMFYPQTYPQASIHSSANIDSSATIGDGCVIEAGAVIMANVTIGAGCYIEANVVICESVQIGDRCRVGAGASVSHSIIGDDVRLYPGVRVGQDGFGFAIDPSGFVKVPQLGRVIIEDHVEVGANTTIDRGAGPDTVIGGGCWIDNLVQIGHNVKIGRGCVIVAQAGISGSTELGDYVMVAGQVGIAGHLKIGSGARIAAKSGIMRDVEAGSEVMGYPAVPLRQYMKQVALLQKMAKSNKS